MAPTERIIAAMPDALMITSSFLPGRGGIESYLGELCTLLAPGLRSWPRGARRQAAAARTYLHNRGGTGEHDETIGLAGPLCSQCGRRNGHRSCPIRDSVAAGAVGPRLARLGLRYASLAFGAELFVPAAVPYLRKRFIDSLAQADLLLPMSDATERRLKSLIEANGNPLPTIEVMRARRPRTFQSLGAYRTRPLLARSR